MISAAAAADSTAGEPFRPPAEEPAPLDDDRLTVEELDEVTRASTDFPEAIRAWVTGLGRPCTWTAFQKAVTRISTMFPEGAPEKKGPRLYHSGGRAPQESAG